MGPLLVLILLFVVMYAAMIRPQQKRARQHQALIAAVQVGDEVMTTAGIFGTVTAVEDDVISVEISPGTVMRVARAAIGRRMGAELEEYEAGETFDDVDDELGDSVADEAASNNGAAVGGDGSSAATLSPEAPPAAEAPPAPPVPPVTPTLPESPPVPPGSGPAAPGTGPGSSEPG
jgi:preprotein translocase subunit YajC